MTQNESILAYLKSHDGISTLEACDRLRIFRLSQRIIELTDKGYSFSHTPETTQSGARVIRYRLQSNTGDKRSASNVSCGPLRAPDVLEAGTHQVTQDSPPKAAPQTPRADSGSAMQRGALESVSAGAAPVVISPGPIVTFKPVTVAFGKCVEIVAEYRTDYAIIEVVRDL